MTDCALPPPPKPYPGFAQALLVLFLFLLFASLATIPSLVLVKLHFPRWGAWALFLGQLGACYLTLRACRSLGQRSWPDWFPHRKVPLAVWPLVAVATLGLILVTNGLEAGLSHLLPPPAWFERSFQDMGWPSLVLGAPLSEEPLFRGLILGGFILRYGAPKAIAYSALMFALVHLNPWQFPIGLLAGLLLGWLTVRTGSLWPAVFAHVLNNLSASLTHAFQVPYLADARTQPVWMWGLGFLLLGLGLAGLNRILSESPVNFQEQAAGI